MNPDDSSDAAPQIPGMVPGKQSEPHLLPYSRKVRMEKRERRGMTFVNFGDFSSCLAASGCLVSCLIPDLL